ncbi:MAG: FliA/WhiG family RNA polymerase sigma factor [Lachnospiraceae bacterium]|nr:FliA/WhiG family RNA polymerase sigma factor [Lachnospiraceae bacterium]
MNEAEKNRLWETYSKSRNMDIREKLILEYAPLVKIIAGRLSMYLGYNVEYEDLVSYGIFGLIDAIDKFDYGKGIKFETYASLRIRGSILDQIRKMDWIPRSLRQKQKRLETAMTELETRLGRVPTDEELAQELEISVDELCSWEGQSMSSTMMSLDEFTEQGVELKETAVTNSRFETPEQVVEQEEIKRILAETLETLTDKEKKVILLYYYEELTLKEISLVMEVSESRVSQLHTKGLQKLRQRLGVHGDALFGF